MNRLSSSSALTASRPLTDRLFAGLRDSLHSMTHAVALRWHAYLARRRETRAPIGVSEMDAHILRDIGAPDELIARAAEVRTARREIPFQLPALLLAIGAAAMLAPMTAEAEDPHLPPDARTGRQMEAVFTGDYVDGAPVYRFPAVVVAGSRNAGAGRRVAPCSAAGPGRDDPVQTVETLGERRRTRLQNEG